MKTTKNYLLLVVMFLMMVSGLQACMLDTQAIHGDKNVVDRAYAVDEFNRISVSGMFKIYLIEGEENHLYLETDENLHEYVTAEVRNNTLYLGLAKGNNYRPSRMDAYITLSALESMDLSGATSLEADHTIAGEMLAMHLSGASNIELDVDVVEMVTHVSGAGSVNLSGAAREHEIRLSGAASLKCRELITEKTLIRLSGAGSAHVYASQLLEARLSGVGSIRYGGNPQNTSFEKSGLGSIKPF